MQGDNKIRQVAITYCKDQNKEDIQAGMTGNNKGNTKRNKNDYNNWEQGEGERLFTHNLLIYYKL